MLSLLLATMIGWMCPIDYYCPYGTLCSCGDGHGPVDATINLTIQIESARMLSVNMEEVEPYSSIYCVTVAGLLVGVPDAINTEKKFLVMDSRRDNSGEMIACNFMDDFLEVSSADEQVVVMEWSESAERMALATAR